MKSMFNTRIFIQLAVLLTILSSSFATIGAPSSLRRLVESAIVEFYDPYDGSDNSKPTIGDGNQSFSGQQIENHSKNGFISDLSLLTKKLPGVVSAGDLDARLYVRGGDSDESIFILDGHIIKTPYFWNGKSSLINPLLIETLNFYATAFPAKYPGVLSGIFDITHRKGNVEKLHMELDQSLTDVQLLIEGPSKLNEHSFVASIRSTYYDYLIKTSDTILPHLDSSSFKFNFNLSNGHELSLNLSHYFDALKISQLQFNQGSDGSHLSASSRKMGLLNLDSNWGESLKTHAKLGYEYSNFQWEVTNGSTTSGTNSFSNPIFVALDMETNIFDAHEIEMGIYARNENISYDEENLNQAPNFDYPGSTTQSTSQNYSITYPYAGVYIQDEFPLMNDVILNGGIRYSTVPNSSLSQQTLVQPRLSIKLLNEKKNIALALSWGQYGSFKNPVFNEQLADVTPEKATHYNISLENKIDSFWRAKADLFLKSYSDRVTSLYDTNTGVLTGYDNSTIGESKGFEFFVERKNATDWNTVISYSLSYARYKESGSSWIYSDHDQRHTLNWMGDIHLGSEWKIVGNWTLSTGKPYTNVLSASYDSGRSGYIPTKESTNSSRLPDYNNLTLSIEYSHPLWPFNHFMGSTYIGVQNAFNNNNIYGYYWSEDYSSKSEIKMLPILPFIGMKVIF
jgi:hypothetical protein